MKIKDLRNILSELGPECDEYPVRVMTKHGVEMDDEEDRFVDLDEQNWELLGTTERRSFLNLHRYGEEKIVSDLNPLD